MHEVRVYTRVHQHLVRMYVCMYIMFVSGVYILYIYMHAVLMYVCMRLCMYVCATVTNIQCAYVCMYVCIRNVCMRNVNDTCACKWYACVRWTGYIYIYIYIHTHIYTHIQIHTYIHRPSYSIFETVTFEKHDQCYYF